MASRHSSAVRFHDSLNHLSVCRMYEIVNLPPPACSMRAKRVSNEGNIAVGPGQANVAPKYSVLPIHLVHTSVPTTSFRADHWPHTVDVEKDEVLAFFLADRRGVAASNRFDLLWVSFLRDHGQ